MDSFYTHDELAEIGFAAVGNNVYLSRKASIYSPEKISISDHVRIDDFCILSGGAGIHIGSFIHISAYAALYGEGGLILEDFVSISPRSTVFTATDDFSGASLVNPLVPESCKPGYSVAEVRIKKHCVVGANSTILPGVVLETGVAIGAHSLVNQRCEAWGIYAGVPARKIKERSKDLLRFEDQVTRHSE